VSAATESSDRRVNAQQSSKAGSATFYKYKSKYGGMEPSDAKRLRALEDENGKLKKMVTPAVRREAVVYLCEAHNVSYAAAPAGDCITPQACFQHDAICREGAGV
jgi:putative transposase